MKKIALFFLLTGTCFTAWSQSTPQLDSLLHVPGLYLIAYPDDGPKEALKGLKPVFCKDPVVINTFLHAMELKPDTSCTGNAYYNYIIQFSSDQTKLDTTLGCSFDKSRKDDVPIISNRNDEYFSFNLKALSYLKANSTILKKETYTCNTLQQTRAFYNFLQQTTETFFIANVYDDAFTKYDGSVLLQFEYADSLSYEDGEKFIRDRISQITVSNDYFYHLKEAHWRKKGFTTEKIVLHTNQKNLLPTSAIYTIQSWSSYGPIGFIVYSNRSKDIEAYFKK